MTSFRVIDLQPLIWAALTVISVYARVCGVRYALICFGVPGAIGVLLSAMGLRAWMQAAICLVLIGLTCLSYRLSQKREPTPIAGSVAIVISASALTDAVRIRYCGETYSAHAVGELPKSGDIVFVKARIADRIVVEKPKENRA